MNLVKQTTLYFREGNSDKIYEVELCEVNASKFLVNFRYGRRGATLREGTKTTAPVSLDEAEIIFEKLVSSKTAKGYSERPDSDATTPAAVSAAESSLDDKSQRSLGPRESGILNRISAGAKYKGTWKLSRAIWRAGEIGLAEAEPLLHKLVGLDLMTNYSIAWTMGRIGSPNSIAILKQLAQNTAHPHVGHIATEALRCALPPEQRDEMVANAARSLPAPLDSFLNSDSGDAFQSALQEGLGSKYNADVLNILYFIDSDITRKALIATLANIPFEPPFFRSIRRIFKAAEMRGDGQVYGLLAYRFELHRSRFRVPSYTWGNYKKPTLGENPQCALGVQTRDYFRRRSWNTLHRLGQLEHPSFVPMAVGTLLPFTDDDAKPVRSDSYYNYNERNYEEIHWDVFGSYWAFNQLLYHNSPRYQPMRGKKNFRVAKNFQPGCPPPIEHEEAFPDLWRKQPRGLLHLLTESRCRPVHEFAVKSIRKCQDFLDELPNDVLQILLQSTYEITAGLGLDLATKRFDASAPDFDLVLMLANCPLGAARNQAKAWMTANQSRFFADTDFMFSILTCPYQDTRSIGVESLFVIMSDRRGIQVLTGRLVSFLQSANTEQAEIAKDVGNNLLHSTFHSQVSTLGEDVICDLLKSELSEVQLFAGSAVLAHSTLAKSPTEYIMRALLDASHPPVRAMGIKVISNLPHSVLAENASMLAGLTCHEHDDIREEIRPLVKEIADRRTQFGKQMASELVQRLLTPGAPDGVPSHTIRVIREDLNRHLNHIESSTVLRLLRSRSGPAQELGGYLLPTHVKPQRLTVSEIVKLTNHSILTVREAAWKMYEADVHRMKAELATAVRILDSDWEDSRQFGFEFLRQKVDDSQLTSDVLISICDSVRPDVQQFGRGMITQQFSQDQGPEYLLKLSEHPTASLQLFASNFLVEYGSDNLERLKQLSPYFVSVLSRVNKSRVAKNRILTFLKSEAQKNQESARIISGILDRISATCAIGDRAKTIESMLEIHERYSDIELPLQAKTEEVR